MKTADATKLVAENEALRRRISELEANGADAHVAAAAKAADFSAVAASPASASPDELLRYRILTESAFDIVCEIDEQARFRYLSPNYFDVLGWDTDKMTGTAVLAMIHPEDQASATEQIRQSFSAGWGRVNVRVEHTGGSWRWFESIGRRFESPADGPRILVISRDITDRVRSEEQLHAAHAELEERVSRRTAELAETNSRLLAEIADRELAEQQLRSSEERLRRTVENVPDVIITLDRDGTIQSFHMPTSPHDQETVVGSSAYEWVPESQREMMRGRVEHVFATGETVAFEVQDSAKRDWYSSRVGPIKSDGQVTGAVLISSNVTAQKKAEQDLRQSQQVLERRIIERTQQLAAANEQLRLDILRREETERRLRESEERFRAIAEANPVPVLISRFADGRILYGNDRLVEMLGTERQKLLTQSTVEYYSKPEDRTQLMRALSREGLVTDYELKAKRRDGTPLWLWISNRRITYQGASAVLTSFLDIGGRKRDEERLKHEQTVLKQMLELQDRDRQLTAYEIHDGLVQDMTGSLLYLEAARNAPTNREHTQNLNKSLLLLQGSIGEARRLINGLRPPILDEQGVVPAVQHLIADVRQVVGLKVRLKHAMRAERLTPALENTIYRVVQEALTNVHRHSGVQSATVELIENDGWLRISIRDRGKGFDPSNIPTSRFGISGIQERARLFGGQAVIRSAPGKGATIIVSIPLADLITPPTIDAAAPEVHAPVPMEIKKPAKSVKSVKAEK